MGDLCVVKVVLENPEFSMLSSAKFMRKIGESTRFEPECGQKISGSRSFLARSINVTPAPDGSPSIIPYNQRHSSLPAPDPQRPEAD
jgi:NADH pyrophosphatase NudC (nudix superfamily)